jgi:hypothetical protein
MLSTVSILSSKPSLSTLNTDTVYNISPYRLGLEDNIDTVYNISVDRLGLEENITVSILSSEPSLSRDML